MYLTTCTEEQLREFYDEFNVTEESMKKDVEYLKEWLRKQPHLPNIEDNDWLQNFLLRCKNSLEKTKKKLEDYYIARAVMPEVFQNRDPCLKEIEKTFKHGMYVPFPKLTSEGYRITIFRVYGNSINNIPDADSVMKCIQMCSDMSVKLDKIRGMILIYDCENVSISYISMIFSILKKIISLGTRTTPARIHKIFMLNLIPAAEPVIAIAKSLLKKEIADRIEILKGKSKDLSQFLPKELLPSDYGGTGKTSEEMRDLYYEQMTEFREWFINEEKNKADLSKKAGNLENGNGICASYGIEGSFRKICLD